MPDCSELKNALIHVLSGLTYMSNDVIRKSGTYLDEVELLDSNSVEPITRNVKTLLQRININLTQFGVTFDTAVENYKKEQEIEKVKTVVSPKPHAQTLNVTSDADAVFPKTTNNKNEVYFQQPSKPGPSNSGVGSFEEAVIKEESRIDGDYTECDDSRLDLKTELNESSGKEGDINDELEAEMKLDENDEADRETLPCKSKAQYQRTYEEFNVWRNQENVTSVNEEVVLHYLRMKAQKMSPSSLWCIYSMIKKTLMIKENVHLGKCGEIISFLKHISTGYEPKKTRVLSHQDIQKFLREASDEEFLFIKVVLIFAVTGCCRGRELHDLNAEDIRDLGEVLVVTIKDTKPPGNRHFTIINEGFSVDPIALYRKYAALRPKDTTLKQFFLGYRFGKCVNQPVGKNTFSAIPSRIAEYLKLENPKSYTGHCFRRSSTSIKRRRGRPRRPTLSDAEERSKVARTSSPVSTQSDDNQISNSVTASDFNSDNFCVYIDKKN